MEKAREVLVALADSSRLKIVNLLVSKNYDLNKISKELNLSEGDTVKSILELKKHGLVVEDGGEYKIGERYIDSLSKFLGNLKLSNID